MGKYLVFFKNSISESLIYRTSVFLVFFSQLISTAVFIFLWSAIYKEGGQIGNYTLDGLIQYFLLVGMLNFSIHSLDVSWRVSEDIRLGNVTNYILKPLSYFKSVLAAAAGKSCVNSALLLIIIPMIALGGYFGDLSWDLSRLLIIAIFLVMAFFLFVTFSYVVGLYAFWVGDGRGFNYAMKLVMSFFSGGIIPLNLLPDYVSGMGDFLPFRNMTWIPISLMTGKMEPNWSIFFSGVIWIMVLFLIAKLVYKQALKQYEGLGV